MTSQTPIVELIGITKSFGPVEQPGTLEGHHIFRNQGEGVAKSAGIMLFQVIGDINIPVENFRVGITYIKILNIVNLWFPVSGPVLPDIHQVEVFGLRITLCDLFDGVFLAGFIKGVDHIAQVKVWV